MEKLTMSVDELATTLGISRPKAYELAHSEGFPTLRVGRRIRISAIGLRDWIENQTKTQQDR